MIISEIRELKTDQSTLRKFGLLVGAVFLGLGLLYLLRHKPVFPWFCGLGIALIALGAALPKLLKPVYLVWMSAAVVLGFIVSNVLLTLLFVLVITPIGLLARVCGKDFLLLKLDRSAASYWIARKSTSPREPSAYDRQF
jgi:hypothetical protein